MNRFFVFAVLTALAGAALSGCHDPNSPSPGGSGDSQAPIPSTGTTPAVNTPVSPPAKLVIYVINPKATGDQDLLVARQITLLHPDAPAKDALNALLQSSHSPIAPGTALRGISIDSGVATVDFSQSPVNETGGESGQSAALNSLAMTLGQFPEINTYQIQVKGQPQTSFGEFTADGPQAVIRPGEASASKGTGL